MTIDNNTTFASLGLDRTQLSSLLKSCNVDSAEIPKILDNPSVYKLADVVQSFEPGNFKVLLEVAKGGDASTVTNKQMSKFEQLVIGLLDLMAKNNELELQQNNASLKSNETARTMSIEGNAKIAAEQRINAVFSAIGGAIGIAAGVKSLKLVGSNMQSGTGVTASSGLNNGVAEKAGAYNAIGNSASGITSSIGTFWSASVGQEGRNLQANAEFVKSNTESMRTAAAAISKVNENLSSIIGQAGSVVQTASRA